MFLFFIFLNKGHFELSLLVWFIKIIIIFFSFLFPFRLGKNPRGGILFLLCVRTAGTADMGSRQWLRAVRSSGDEAKGEELAKSGLGRKRAGGELGKCLFFCCFKDKVCCSQSLRLGRSWQVDHCTCGGGVFREVGATVASSSDPALCMYLPHFSYPPSSSLIYLFSL